VKGGYGSICLYFFTWQDPASGVGVVNYFSHEEAQIALEDTHASWVRLALTHFGNSLMRLESTISSHGRFTPHTIAHLHQIDSGMRFEAESGVDGY
jgi:hypothetical protein